MVRGSLFAALKGRSFTATARPGTYLLAADSRAAVPHGLRRDRPKISWIGVISGEVFAEQILRFAQDFGCVLPLRSRPQSA